MRSAFRLAPCSSDDPMCAHKQANQGHCCWLCFIERNTYSILIFILLCIDFLLIKSSVFSTNDNLGLTHLHSEWPELYGVLAILSAIGLKSEWNVLSGGATVRFFVFTSHISLGQLLKERIFPSGILSV